MYDNWERPRLRAAADVELACHAREHCAFLIAPYEGCPELDAELLGDIAGAFPNAVRILCLYRNPDVRQEAVGSVEVAADTFGGKLRNIVSTDAISSEENANFGRASTAEYSSSISSEKQGCTRP